MVDISLTTGNAFKLTVNSEVIAIFNDANFYGEGTVIVLERQDGHEIKRVQLTQLTVSSVAVTDLEDAAEKLIAIGLGFNSGGGSGSGATETLIGFIDYNDTTGAISLSANTWTTIPNNGLGAFTNKTYKPPYVTELMNVTTGAIDPTELFLGDSILIRNDYTINPNTNNALLEFRYSLGTGGGAYTLEKIIGRLDSGSGQDYRFSLDPDLIYMGDTNTKDNPILLQVRLSTTGTLTNAGSVIKVLK